MAIYTDSLEGKLKTLQATWEQFVLDLQASEAFKTIIDLGTKLISLLDVLLNKIPILSDLIKTALAVGAIGVLVGSLQKLLGMLGVFTTLEKQITVVKNFASVIGSLPAAFKAAQTFGTSFSAMLQGVAMSAGLSATAASTLVAALAPLAVVGIGVGLVAFIGYLNSAEKAAKDAEKAVSEYKEEQQKIESAQSELDTINDKIAEINAKDGLTLTDKQELENLKEQRAELEALIKTYENLAETQRTTALKAEQKAVKKELAKGDSTGTASDYGRFSEKDLSSMAINYDKDSLDDAVGLYKRYIELQKEAGQQGKTLSEESQKNMSDLASHLQDRLEYLEQEKETLEALGDTESEEYQQVVANLGMIEQATAPEAWQEHQLSNLLLGDDVSDVVKQAKDQIDELKQQLADGVIDQETYTTKLKEVLAGIANDPDIQEALKNIFPDLDTSDLDTVINTLAQGLGVDIPTAADATIYKIDDMKTGLSDLDDRLGNLKSGMENLGNIDLSSITDLEDMNEALAQGEDLINSYENELNGLQTAYDSLGANVDAAGAALDFLSSNMEDIVNSGEAGYKAISDVINGAGELVNVVDTATGEVINVQDRITAIMEDETLTQQQKQQAVMALQGDIQNAGNNTITTMNAVIDAIVKVKQELASALNAAASFVENVQSSVGNLADKVSGSFGGKVLKAFGVDASDLKTAVSGLSGVADTLRNKSQEITNSIQNDKAELIKGVEEYQTKLNSAAGGAEKAYKKVQDAANKAGSSGSGSTKKQTDATKELTDALKEEYEAQKAILDAQKKQLQARKEALNQEKSDLADAKDAIEDLIDMTMSMLKQKYQDQLDILEKQQDALDEQKDAFDKKIEQQKEYLKLQKEEQDHANELAEKNQAIADVQAELEELRYDNSAAGQKKRLELLDSLNTAQKDLTDYQNQYDYDTKVDELDKEKDAFQQQIEAQKDAIDQQKEYIKNTLMDEYNLYLEAIQLIQGRSDEFYNSLLE